MKVIGKVLVCAAMVAATGALSVSAATAQAGSCYKMANALSTGERTVRLVPEYMYDSFNKTYYETGSYVQYYKLPMRKGNEATIWIEGGDTLGLTLNVDINWDDYFNWDISSMSMDFPTIPFTSFTTFDYDNGKTKTATLAAEDWYSEDPASVTYYAVVRGDSPTYTCTLHYTPEVHSFLPLGSEGNPHRLIMDERGKETVENDIDFGTNGVYYFKATLVEGYSYRIGLTGGTAASDFAIDRGATELGVDWTEDPERVDPYNPAYILTAKTSGTYVFSVTGAEAEKAGDILFGIRYKLILPRKIADHGAAALDASHGYAAAFVPGRRIAGLDFADDIIDEHLYKIVLGKSEDWVFATDGATVPCEMVLYDSTGKVLLRNTSAAKGSYDTRIGYTSSSKGETVYVGVCNPALGPADLPTGEPLTLIASKRTPTEGEPDVYETSDDTRDGANGLTSVPADAGADPVKVGSKHGPHQLGATDWEDWYVIAGRADITYRVATSLAVAESTSFKLLAELYVNTGKSPEMTQVLNPGDVFSFTAKKDEPYYIRFTVNDGPSLSYPDYFVHSTAYGRDGAALGMLRGESVGASGTFSVGTSKTQYPAGSSVLVEAGPVAVKFASVKGYNTPILDAPGGICTVTEGEETVVTAFYNDTSDPKDDTRNAKSATKFAPSAKVQTITGHTLLTNDPEDNYLFTAKAGVYYNFALTDLTKGGMPGDARMTIRDEADGIIADCEDVTELIRKSFAAGNYYLTVAHEADEKKDFRNTTYNLVHTGVNVGEIKFAKTEVSVKDSVATVALTVNRTSKEGRVRVKYGTVAGEGEDGAKPGVDYVAQSGILEWANGDSKAKTITVKLIPPLKAAYQPDREFSVRLEPIDGDDLADDEYPAQIGVDTKKGISYGEATVTVTASAKKVPGTIVADSFETSSTGPVEIENPKKATAAVLAGEKLIVYLDRTIGLDDAVGVKISLKAGKGASADDCAIVGSDTITWDADEQGLKSFIVNTKAFADYTETKAFTISIAKLSGTGFASPTIGTSSIALTIVSQRMRESMATYVKGLPKKPDVTVKEAKAGTWYVENDGAFRSLPIDAKQKTAGLTFTVVGPARFTVRPTVSDGAELTVLVGRSKTAEPVVSGEARTFYLPSGNQTLAFTATRALDAVQDPDVRFEVVDGINPYDYTALPAAVAAAPTVDKAYVLSGKRELKFVREAGVAYEVFLVEGKTVTEIVPEADGRYFLACEAGKKYSWRADSCFTNDLGEVMLANTNKTAWTLNCAAATAGSMFFAGENCYGQGVVTDGGETVMLVQGVAASFSVAGADATAVKVLSGKLPDGLNKFVRVNGSYEWKLEGVPTKAGTYEALLQVTQNNKAVSATVAMTFIVAPADSAIGTFNGLLEVDGMSLTNGLPSVGTVALTVSKTMGLTAKVSIAGKSYSFKGAGFDLLKDETSVPGAGVTRTLMADLELAQKVDGEAYTATLSIELKDVDSTDLSAMGEVAGTADLLIAIPDAKGNGAQTDIAYHADLYRDNTKSAEYLAAFANFAGYYTVALPIVNPEYGKPQGNGYVTVTLDAKGKAKVGGMLADGTSVSCSLLPALVGDLSDEKTMDDWKVVVPVFQAKSPCVFGGNLILRRGERSTADVAAEGIPPVVADPDTMLRWANDNIALTRDGEEGWDYWLSPAGGWYDTVYNLQTSYLNRDFEVDSVGTDEYPEELLGLGKYASAAFYPETAPQGQTVNVIGEAVSVDKQVLVKGADKMYDFTDPQTVNPSGLSVSFKRATGVISGSFTPYMRTVDSKDKVGQVKLGAFKHQGVLITQCDAASLIDPDVWSAGYCLAPAASIEGYDAKGKKTTRKYTASYRFNILAVDPGETDPWADDWGENPEQKIEEDPQ